MRQTNANGIRWRLLGAVSLAAMTAGMCGCYHSEDLVAFLKTPRSPVAAEEYRIAPPDVLTIKSLRVPEVDQATQQVRPDGCINLPLLGEVFVAGKTPQEVEEMLIARAERYYADIELSVEVLQYNSRRFYVFGEVYNPGPLPWTGRDSLLDALAKTMPNRIAWPERVLVVRGDAPQVGGFACTEPEDESKTFQVTGVRDGTPDRPRHTLVVNLNAMIKKGDMSSNILLMPDDIVYVPPNPFAETGLAIQQILFPVTGVRDLWLEGKFWANPNRDSTTISTSSGGLIVR